MFELSLFWMFPAAMAFAGAMDFFTMTIPNRICLALIACFAVAVASIGAPFEMIVNHVAAGLLFLVIGIFLFTMKWLGGGDAKLLAAVALWFGFESLFSYVILVTLIGGVLATAILGFRKLTPPVWLMGQDWAFRLHDRQGGIPYGIALAGAALWIYPSTHWLLAFSS